MKLGTQTAALHVSAVGQHTAEHLQPSGSDLVLIELPALLYFVQHGLKARNQLRVIVPEGGCSVWL